MLSDLIPLILALLVLTTVFLYIRHERPYLQQAAGTVLVAVLVCVLLLLFPIYRQSYNFVTSLMFSLLYGFRALAGRQPLELIYTLDAAPWLRLCYYALLYPMFMLTPVLTTGVILSFIGNLNDQVRFLFCRRRRLHVFSSLDESSLCLAESISEASAAIVFCNQKTPAAKLPDDIQKRLRNIGAMVLKSSEEGLDLRPLGRQLFDPKNRAAGRQTKYAQVVFYETGQNNDHSLQHSTRLLDKYCDHADGLVEILLFAHDPAAELALSVVRRGNVRVRLQDPVRLACYRLLDEHPLFSAWRGRQLNVLLVGAGRCGLELLRAISWCGQLDAWQLRIRVVDVQANRIEAEFYQHCPGMRQFGADIQFYQTAAPGPDFDRVISEHCLDSDYIVVAMGEDNQNINTGMHLRRFFLEYGQEKYRCRPQIIVRTRDPLKSGSLSSDSASRNKFGLCCFGNVRDVYSSRNLRYSQLELLAENVHLAYCGLLDAEEGERQCALRGLDRQGRYDFNSSFYDNEYNQSSSLATALHIKYKLFSAGVSGLGGAAINGEQLAAFAERLAETAEFERIIREEHRRWQFFMCSEGYRQTNRQDVAAYYQVQVEEYDECFPETRPHHQNRLLKLHPALADWDELPQWDGFLSQLRNKTICMKEIDRQVIRLIPQIVESAQALQHLPEAKE